MFVLFQVTKLKLLPEIFATAAEFEGVLAARDSDQESIKNYVAIFSRMNAAKTGGKKADSEVSARQPAGARQPASARTVEGTRLTSPPCAVRTVEGTRLTSPPCVPVAAKAPLGASPACLYPPSPPPLSLSSRSCFLPRRASSGPSPPSGSTT